MSFEPITIGRLPRVLVHVLAMKRPDRATLVERFQEAFPDWRCDRGRKMTPESLGEFCVYLILLKKKDRRAAIDTLNAVLDRLLSEDFFGTEGQNDPRGDHRE